MSTCSKRLSGVIAAISITALTAATFMGIKSTPANAISLDTTSAALNYANNFDGFYSVPAHYSHCSGTCCKNPVVPILLLSPRKPRHPLPHPW